MNRIIRKKKGLLKEPRYEQIKKELFQAVEEKAAALEEWTKHSLIKQTAALEKEGGNSESLISNTCKRREDIIQ